MQQIIKLNTDVACYCELDTSSESCNSQNFNEEKKGEEVRDGSNDLFNVDSSKKVNEQKMTLLWSREHAKTKLLGQKWGKEDSPTDFNLKIESQEASPDSNNNQIKS